MTTYIIRRSAEIVPTVLFVLTVMFFLLSILPGDAALLAGDPRLAKNPSAIKRVKQKWGLNDPIPIRYFKYLFNLFQGDLGTSYRTHEKVSQLLLRKIPPTFILVGVAYLFATPIGLALGFVSGIDRGSIIDFGSMSLAIFGVSVPRFWVGLMLMYLFAVLFHGLLPASGYGGAIYYVLPSITLGYPMIALVARITRSSVLEVIQKDYVRTARSKGASEWTVNLKHVFRNSILPIMTVSGLQLGGLVANTVIVERVFSWPGIGTLTINSIMRRDIPAIQACVFVFVLVVVVLNTLVDILYAYLDPRITYS